MNRPRQPRPTHYESDVQDAIREALGLEADLVLWRNNTGVAVHWDDRSGKERRVRYGLCPGGADLIGLLGPSGRIVALEVKRPAERPTDDQRAFLTIVRRHGGFAAIVHSVDEAVAAVARAREGKTE